MALNASTVGRVGRPSHRNSQRGLSNRISIQLVSLTRPNAILHWKEVEQNASRAENTPTMRTSFDSMSVRPSLRSIAKQALGPRGIEFVRRHLSRAYSLIQAAKNEPPVRIASARSKKPGTSPKGWFSGLDDETWFWMNTFGRRRRKAIARLVAKMPEVSMQETFTGSSGDSTLREGFNAYRLFKKCYETHVGPIGSCRAVLDFGCGWGRIIRFFLKDVEPESLFGVDH